MHGDGTVPPSVEPKNGCYAGINRGTPRILSYRQRTIAPIDRTISACERWHGPFFQTDFETFLVAACTTESWGATGGATGLVKGIWARDCSIEQLSE